jgi:hypothetical protein
VTVNGTTMTSPAAQPAGGGITISPAGSGNVTTSITNNNISSRSSSINHNIVGGSSLVRATITGNTLSAPVGDGVQLYASKTGALTALVENNTMQNYNFAGIDMQQGDGDGSINATIRHNTISAPGANAFAGIVGVFGTSAPNSGGGTDSGTSCVDIGGAATGVKNSVAGSMGPTGVSDIRIRQRFDATVRMPGYGGGPNDTAAVNSYLAARNDGNGTPTVTSTTNVSSAIPPGGYFNTAPAGSACPLP